MGMDYHKSDILDSIRGTRIGLDHNGFIAGVSGARNPNERVTSATTLGVGGTSLLGSTDAAAFTVAGPSAKMLGVQKRIVNDTTLGTTDNMYVKLGSGNFVVDDGTSKSVCRFTSGSRGQAVTLEYVSTALVAVLGRTSTALVLFATST